MMLNLTKKQKLIIIVFIISFLAVISFRNHLKEKKEIYILSESNQDQGIQYEDHKLDIQEFKSTIIVHIEGEILNPGIYQLQNDARVFDVVEKAGGLKNTADRKMINLAKKVIDEEFIYIPSYEDTYDSIQINTHILQQDDGRININQADKIQLETLPGIGSALAERIIQYRNEVGAFQNIEEIQNVSGIGEKKYNDIKSIIKVK
ncbi:competence protein ComEA [Natronincola peptidivorans]|uniref:Competence protein ComEA n=1 Tax=Natronincola peptidivorans TaxID=426128 RepID=A0A1H9YY36_9FIRM|nr:helix-hairpin-helix domain-containing protein [Natronincola peptidivorans]SES74130.1 competence protein ComEA [Natronincola peptidivorans]